MLFFSWFTFLCSGREQVPSMFSFYIDCFYDSALQTSTVTVFDLVALKNTEDKTCPKTKYFLSALVFTIVYSVIQNNTFVCDMWLCTT